MPDLTELEIRNARPKDKPYKLSEGRGLVLLVNPDGSRYWRLRSPSGAREADGARCVSRCAIEARAGPQR